MHDDRTNHAADLHEWAGGTAALCRMIDALYDRVEQLDGAGVKHRRIYQPDHGGAVLRSVPNLREAEGTDRLRTTAKLRSRSDVLDQADLAFCITWSCAESNLKRTPHVGAVDQYVIWERRSAIEWLLGDDWDHPDLST